MNLNESVQRRQQSAYLMQASATLAFWHGLVNMVILSTKNLSPWPGQSPFSVSRHEIPEAVRQELGDEASRYIFSADSNRESLFNYEMHTLPNEIGNSIGTSTLLAAWNAATYVAQIDDDRLEAEMHGDDYISNTRDVLNKRGGL